MTMTTTYIRKHTHPSSMLPNYTHTHTYRAVDMMAPVKSQAGLENLFMAHCPSEGRAAYHHPARGLDGRPQLPTDGRRQSFLHPGPHVTVRRVHPHLAPQLASRETEQLKGSSTCSPHAAENHSCQKG